MSPGGLRMVAAQYLPVVLERRTLAQHRSSQSLAEQMRTLERRAIDSGLCRCHPRNTDYPGGIRGRTPRLADALPNCAPNPVNVDAAPCNARGSAANRCEPCGKLLPVPVPPPPPMARNA